jgi:NAD(P)-dependent dehydrogenase (short-subunit alcohol dehydrogenase family)
MSLLDGKRAIVTGGGRNIGAEYCKALAREGAHVVVADIDEEGANLVAKEVREAGGSATALRVDITDPESVNAMVAQTVEELGGIDILVNNAALYGGLKFDPPDSTDLDEWDRVMKINVKGTFIVARAVGQQMVSQGSGSIVNIASTTAHMGPPFLIHYAASKGAILTLTRSLARAYGEDGIRVNAIAPGLIWDKATTDMLPDELLGDIFVEQQVIKRRQSPEDLLGPLLFFASDLSQFVTGQTLVVDGGLFMP